MTHTQDFPDLVRTHLTSVWSLELLLLLRRQPERRWTVAALTQELRATDRLVATALARLERSGLAAQDGASAFRYAPASPLLSDFGDMIAGQYQERPVSIINLIVAPEDRIQQLADAFRFRSDRR